MEAESERDRSAFVAAAVRDTRFAKVSWVAETGSTNDDLVKLAGDGGPDQALIADLQTAGRGRRDRLWTAPADSAVLMSLLIRVNAGSSPFWTIGAVALAAASAVTERVDGACQLKWPNDLMIAESKVAGVLAQLVDEALVVGIGINVNWGVSPPEGVPAHATALDRHAGGDRVDRTDLVIDVLRRADRTLNLGTAELRSEWIQNCATIGQLVRVELDGEAVVGRAVSIDDDGAVVIDTGGERRSFHSGDVVPLRAL